MTPYSARDETTLARDMLALCQSENHSPKLPPSPAAHTPTSNLKQQVASMARAGYTTRQIMTELRCARSTVKEYARVAHDH